MADPIEITLLPIAGIVANPRNVNQGDIGAIATAIAVDGWHGSCLVKDRGKKELPEIVVGEHRWRALELLQRDGFNGQTYAELAAKVPLPPVGFVPVQVQTMDDTRALRKMLSDNRASALATSDDAALIELLTELATDDALFGSLFDGDDIDQMIADLAAEPLEPQFGGKEPRPVTCPACGAEFIPGEDS